MIARTGPFPRAQRIRRSRDFRDLARRGRRRSTESFVVLSAASMRAVATGRLGITVSRRVGNAVVRNRVKRRVREWYRREGRELARDGDWVVIARPAAARLDYAETAAELRGLVLASS